LDNTGPSNVQLSYTATNNRIYRNIFVQSGAGNPNVTAYNLKGTGNSAWDNVGWSSTKVLDSSPNLTDAGGNIMVNPQLGATFVPQEPSVTAYGALAP
jgi:hypothetical protein